MLINTTNRAIKYVPKCNFSDVLMVMAKTKQILSHNDTLEIECPKSTYRISL